MSFLMLLSVMILLSSFVLIGSKGAKTYIRIFRAQSFLIALSAFVIGIGNLFSDDGIDILVISLIILILKVFYIPKLLLKTFEGLKPNTQKDHFMNIPTLEFLAGTIFLFCYFTLPTIKVPGEYGINSYIINSISVILIGILFMISRKRAIGQIVGFLVVENGLFITAMFSTHGMPMVVDMGILIDLITFVLIMGMFTFRIDKYFDSVDLDKLKNLRG